MPGKPLRLKNALRRSSHPWIFKRWSKPAQPKPTSSLVEESPGWTLDGAASQRPFRVAVCVWKPTPDVPADAGFGSRARSAGGDAVPCGGTSLKLDGASARRVFHSEGDGIRASSSIAGPLQRLAGGRVLQRRRVAAPRMDLQRAARAVPRLPLHSFADEHVQKQESFDYKDTLGTQPAIVSEHGIRFRADPAGAHKTGFFADQRENREWLSRQCAGQRARPNAATPAASAVYAASARREARWSASTSTRR